MPVTVPNRFHNVTLAGNTAGVLAEVSSGTLTLAGGNNITLSQAGNAITISGAAAGGAGLSAGLSTNGNTSGDTGLATQRLVFAGGNNITLSGSTNGGSMTITVSGANAAGAQTGISGLANSETTYTSGSVTLSALGAITIRSTTGQHFQFSVNAQSVQPEGTDTIGMSNIGNTSGDTTPVTGTGIRVVLAGGNNITLSQSTNGSSATVTISGANQSVQPEGTQTIGMSNIGNTSGDTAPVTGTGIRVIFAGGNNITLSQSTNGSSATVTISAFNQSAESNTIGMSNIGNTSGDTAIRSAAQLRIVLAGGNNITLSQSTNGSSATITISAFNQTSPVVGNAIQSVSSATDSGTQTSQFAAADHKHAGVGPLGVSNVGNTSGDTGTQYGRVVLAGGNNITLSVSSSNNGAQTITISAPNLAGGAAGTNTIGMSNIGNTSGDTAIRTGTGLQIVFAGGNNITLSQSTNGSSATVTISAFNQTSPVVGNNIQSVSSATDSGAATSKFAAEDHKHAGVGPEGVSNIGNTSGDTGTQYGRVVWAGGNNITLSVSSSNNGAQTITISGAAGGGAGYTAGLSNIGNTSGDTGVVTGRLVLAGGNNVTLSGSTNAGSMTVTISQNPPALGWYIPTIDFRSPGTIGQGTLMIVPWYCPGPMSAHSALAYISAAGSSGSTAGVSIPIGVYTQMTGASSTRLSLLASAQFTSSWTSGSNADSDWGGVSGPRRWGMAINVTFTQGWYWIGIGYSVANVGTYSFAGHGSNQVQSGVLGANNATRHMYPFAGGYGTTTGTPPNSIGSNQIVGAGGNLRVLPLVGFANTDSYQMGA